MNRSGARLSDIAKRTGYSKNTVSLALRDSPRIPETTREVIRAAASALNYRPNHAAKSLTSRQTKTIGLLLADITNPILTETSKALETELARLGYGTLFATSNNTLSDEIAAVEMFRSRQVDGMLVYPTRGRRDYKHLVELRRSGFPIVMMIPGEEIGVDMVSVDEQRGAHMAVRHLIDLGHRRIGLINGDLRETSAQERQAGYLAALETAGIARDPRLVVGGTWRRQDAYSGITRLMEMDDRPTAIFTANYVLAYAVLDYFREHGIQPGPDVSLASFDDIELFRQSSPGVTAVVQPAAAIGETISEIVLGHLTGLRPNHPRTIALDCNIILRQTTRPPRTDRT